MPASPFGTDDAYAVEATRDVSAEIQAFNDANPEYWLLTHGYPPPADDAEKAFDVHPPPDMSYRADLWYLVRDRCSQAIVGQVALVIDLMAEHVWHLGFFMVATRLHGTGLAARVHGAWKAWAQREGARWLRLNVVEVNARGHAFWRRQGYVDVRCRHGFVLGHLTHTLTTMVQPLPPYMLEEYLERVPRDRPALGEEPAAAT
jgi:RimJ/RimL family protein N-acetyltransferase